MNNNNLLIKFLQELFARLFTKSPKFFQIFQWISAILATITGLPEFLQQFNIKLPPGLLVLESKAVAWAAIGSFIMSLLTTQSKLVAKTTGGILKKTDERKLPFTAQVETKSINTSSLN